MLSAQVRLVQQGLRLVQRRFVRVPCKKVVKVIGRKGRSQKLKRLKGRKGLKRLKGLENRELKGLEGRDHGGLDQSKPYLISSS